MKLKLFYATSYLQFCFTSTNVELIPSVISSNALRGLLRAGKCREHIQGRTLSDSQGLLRPVALTQMAYLPLGTSERAKFHRATKHRSLRNSSCGLLFFFSKSWPWELRGNLLRNFTLHLLLFTSCQAYQRVGCKHVIIY